MRRNSYRIILLFTLIVVSGFAARSIAQTSTVVTFDNPAPPGPPDSYLNGIFGGINWGTNQWRWTGPYAADPTNAAYFDRNVQSRSFTFSPGPMVLNSINVYTTANGTLTLSDNAGQTLTRTITTGAMQLVTTGWSLASTTVTVAFTAGWSLGVDDITYRSPGPPDTTPPTVSISSPTSGSTISGTITVAASASDNTGVAGVQFLVDGVNIGAEDTAPPYAASWDTSTVANGEHTLTAIARDAAGNRTTSTPVLVTVSNANPSDPSRIGRWEGPFNWPLVVIDAALLPTGEVLIWDRQNNGQTLSARLWIPATGAFISVPNNFSDLFCGGHAFLADGRLLVVGGHVAAFVGLNDANLFDPQTQRWTPAAPMASPRWYPTATTLPDGRVLVVSGSTNCDTCIADVPEIYNPVTNAWTQLTNARLAIPRYPFMFVLPDGRVLNAGSDEASTVTRVLDIATQTWTTVDPAVIAGGSAVMYLPGRVMKAGSPGNVDLPSAPSVANTYVLNMAQASPAWRQTAPMAFPRAHHTLTLLPDGNTLVVGGGRTTDGVNLTQAVYEAEIWSSATETWTTMARMQVPRLYHSIALLLPDGRVLVAGGGRFEGRPEIDQFSAEIYSPPYLFRGARPDITSTPTAIQYGANFFVETPDASNIAIASLVRLGSVTHSYDQDQRFLSLTFQRVAGGLNVQAPANANLAPPGNYMLFIVNTNGVPSFAEIVQFQAPLADAQPPTIAITSPEPGSTVSGTISVFAEASDNVGVAGVQFLLDGGDLGAEDTTAPYSSAWNTTGVANGQYTLTAVARDAAGNESASDPVTVTVANAQAPPSGLVAAYAFNEGSGPTAGDISGNNNNGAITGATWTTQGRFGRALSFDGTNDWVTVNDSATLDLTTGMTLMAWVYPTVRPTGWRTVIAKEGSGTVIGYFLDASSSNNNRPATGVTLNGGEQQLTGGTRLSANTWAHLAASYDGAALRLYVNGVAVANRALAGAITATSNPLRIGGNSIWGQFFRGRIDEVRLYNRALTASEIQRDMNTPVGP